MKSLLFMSLSLALVHQAAFAALVRVADGDCAGLRQALAADPTAAATTVILASRGSYGYCPIAVTSSVTIDGAGATLQAALAPDVPAISVSAGATLTLRNLNIVGTPAAIPPAVGPNGCGPYVQGVMCPQQERSAIDNAGTLLLDASSLSGVNYDYGDLIVNRGDLSIRNTTIAENNNHGSNFGALIAIGPAGTGIALDHVTIAANTLGMLGVFHADTSPGKGPLQVANSILTSSGGAICYLSREVVQVVSRGGNIVGDDSCGFAATGDKVVADAELGAFGDNGGLVKTVRLNGGTAPIGNGSAANCEASDARGIVRNVAARGGCDAGAYEYGGGRGLLSQGGMNGFFYDAAADGHYVTVQRLDWGSALVIWNTFDRDGKAAWIYSIGEVDGTHVHAQGAQNLGGVLQPGGAPTGSHGAVWGDIDIDFADCFNATFRYASPLPDFGAGEFPLNRLAFLGDLDCSR